MARARALLLVLTALAAGCTAPSPGATPSLEAAPLAQASEPSFVLVRPESRVVPELPASLDLAPRWLKPFRAFETTLSAHGASRVGWFVEHEDVDARASVVDGELYILKATTPDHHDTLGPRTPRHVDGLAADGRARAVRFTHEGRYTYESEGARLVVNVWPGAPAGSAAQAFLVDDGAALRFEPAELDLAPQERLILWSQASRPHDVREVAYAAHVPLPAGGGRATPVDEGLYVLSALVIGDDGARGIARQSFLVDFERPSEFVDVGPATGRFLAGAADDPHRVVFHAAHPLARLDLHVNATSFAPAPASVVVALLDDDGEVARMSTLSARTLSLEELPPGRYVVEVRGEHGALVAFDLVGQGRYRLPVPPRLAP